ncbi:uncharacterized protein L969DRAFT_94972 [Mixia osmundae IAM 14324]|uniref:Major facilitator superfamily (MFS) profile domain-containing protein n=1 Tax=Mixia osmundae (strain CBS 9802 / IAM 14324 / JCM 22182 / KY 12970) TaxID=764103 RepID=G7E157_MIXOS|nr:uncharacterized protein L969DRAFT_94972 [Mixia osmundae IAM 14324]KEI38794.1 hypothetical protein L969DRAFT_94972 [Mixia osmundae IAM 14324]GAA96567.1 hypothetical protein E5Q_03236 [Mixia osmundae IAM 14324]
MSVLEQTASTTQASAARTEGFQSLSSFFAGVVINLLLDGVNAHQLATYCSNFNDPSTIRCLVWTVAVFSLLDTVCEIKVLDMWLISARDDITQLDYYGLPYALHPIFLASLSLPVQVFYGWRVWVLSRHSILLPGIIIIGALVSNGSAMAASVRIWKAERFSRDHTSHVHTGLMLLLPAAIDIITFLAMLYYIGRVTLQNRTIGSQNIFRRLARIAIETNLVTSGIALVCSITITFGKRHQYAPFPFFVANAYLGTLLYSLTSRLQTTAELEEIGAETSTSQDTATALPSPVHIHPAGQAVEPRTSYGNRGRTAENPSFTDKNRYDRDPTNRCHSARKPKAQIPPETYLSLLDTDGMINYTKPTYKDILKVDEHGIDYHFHKFRKRKDVKSWRAHNAAMGRMAAYCLLVSFASIGNGYSCSIMVGIREMAQYQHMLQTTDGRTQFTGFDSLALRDREFYLFGSMLGAVMAAFIADIFGRRKTLLWGCIIVYTGAVLSAVSTWHWLLFAGRFIVGIGSAMSCVAAPIYIAEIISPKLRGLMLGIYGAAWYIGWCLSAVTILGFNKIYPAGTDVADSAWQFPLALQVVPSAILFTYSLSIPESPRWLWTQGMPQKSALYFKHHHRYDPAGDLAQRQITRLVGMSNKQQLMEVWWRQRPTWTALYRASLVLVLSSSGHIQSSALNPKYVEWIRLSAYKSPNMGLYLNFANALAMMGGAIGVAILVERTGRRYLLVGASLLTALLLMVTFAVGLDIEATLNRGEVVSRFLAHTGIGMGFSFGAIFASYTVGMQQIYVCEVATNRHRAWAVASSLIINLLVDLISLSSTKSLGIWVFIPYMALLLFSAAFYWLFAVETGFGKTLEELDDAHFTLSPKVKRAFATLGADNAVRAQAEQRLTGLASSGMGELPLALIRLLLEHQLEIPLRQASGLLLNKYVKEHWSIFFASFLGSPPPHDAKDQIRQALLAGLSDSQRKIRTTCALVIALLGQCDWPDEWPELMNQLLKLLATGQSDSVHGALRVLADFVKGDLTEDQLLPVANDMLPTLLKILCSAPAYSALTRSRTIAIFRECLSALYMVKDTYPDAVEKSLNVIMPQWLSAFVRLLEETPLMAYLHTADEKSWEELAVRSEIFKGLLRTFSYFPKAASPYLPRLLELATRDLSAVMGLYRSIYLNDELDDSRLEPVIGADEGSDVTVTLSDYINRGLEFIGAALMKKPAHKLFFNERTRTATPLLSQAYQLAMFYAQITTDDEEAWQTDPNSFAAEEEEENPGYSLRVASQDLLASLLDFHQKQNSGSAFTAVLKARLNEGEQMRRADQADWWKPLEAVLYTLQSIPDDSDTPPYAHEDQALLRSMVSNYYNATSQPLLQGRVMVFASRQCSILPSDQLDMYIDGAIQVLETTSLSNEVKISALVALKGFCRSAPQLVKARMLRILHNLATFLPSASDNTLTLLLDLMSLVIGLGEGMLNAEAASVIVAIALDTWQKQFTDPFVADAVGDLLEKLASDPSEEVHAVLVRDAAPRITAALALADSTDQDQAVLATSAASLLENVLSGQRSSLSLGMYAAIAPTLLDIGAKTSDVNIVQTVIASLIHVVRKACPELVAYRNPSGASGMQLLLSIIARQLQPEQSESSGLFVGDLLLHVMRKAGQELSDILPDLLRALVTRLALAETGTFSQSLIVPIAYVLHANADQTIELLRYVSLPSGQNGLEIFLRAWADNAETFQGYWQIRISSCALAILLLSDNVILDTLLVKGERILDANSATTIMTRARKRQLPDHFQQIPFRAKALKILLSDLQGAGDSSVAAALQADAESDDGDDGEGWEDETDAFSTKNKDALDLSAMLGHDGQWRDDDDLVEEDEADEDIKNDALYSVNLSEHVVRTLRQAYEQYRALVTEYGQHCLTTDEQRVLQQVLQ